MATVVKLRIVRCRHCDGDGIIFPDTLSPERRPGFCPECRGVGVRPIAPHEPSKVKVWRRADEVTTGDTLIAGPDDVECEVLRIDHGTDSLIGIPVIKCWVRRTDTDEEGYLSFVLEGSTTARPRP